MSFNSLSLVGVTAVDCLKEGQSWMAVNELLLNPTETECILLLSTPQQLMEVQMTRTLKLGESLIKLVYATRNLVGILVIILWRLWIRLALFCTLPPSFGSWPATELFPSGSRSTFGFPPPLATDWFLTGSRPAPRSSFGFPPPLVPDRLPTAPDGSRSSLGFPPPLATDRFLTGSRAVPGPLLAAGQIPAPGRTPWARDGYK